MLRTGSGGIIGPSIPGNRSMFRPGLFSSFFAGGFECSAHRRSDGRRLDLLRSTKHDLHALADYRRLSAHGLRTARDGIRWHLIEAVAGHYDWSSFLTMLHAARDAGIQVVWDLCHYGYPDGLDIWDKGFVERFARFAAAAARIVRSETDSVPFYCPVNEISYWAWAGGTVGTINPAARRRGPELKRQLVRSTIAAIEALREVDPRARIMHAEPLINVVGTRRSYHEAQFEVWEMLTGRAAPELGGRPDYLDIAGLNYYPTNQWAGKAATIPMGHHFYRPLRELLRDVFKRYQRPLYLAETGAEQTARAAWLFYVAGEIRAALRDGLPIEGLCLYPILDYPGWQNGRLCEVGLFSQLDATGRRSVCQDLADELSRQRSIFEELFSATDAGRGDTSTPRPLRRGAAS